MTSLFSLAPDSLSTFYCGRQSGSFALVMAGTAESPVPSALTM